jgi:hypothetical protein
MAVKPEIIVIVLLALVAVYFFYIKKTPFTLPGMEISGDPGIPLGVLPEVDSVAVVAQKSGACGIRN